jgi:glucosamine kinase
MFIIVESGSTKTEWQVCDSSGLLLNIYTDGITPNFMLETHITKVIEEAHLQISMQFDISNIKNIYYYGTGCGYASTDTIINKALSAFFIHSSILIYNDILASARALCQKSSGFTCILGTGSNSCFYDGQFITENRFSPGYVLGDYGSGAHLGITLLKSYLEGDLPSDVLDLFNIELGHNYEYIIENVYRKPSPSKYLASYAKFIYTNKTHPFFSQLIYSCLNEFVNRVLKKYDKAQTLPFHFVGSIAYYFKDEIEFVLKKNNLEMGNVLQTPSEGLLRFHLSK